MAYTPQTWTNGTSKLNATRMSYMENGIEAAAAAADAAAVVAAAAIEKTTITTKGDLIVSTGGGGYTRQPVSSDNLVLVGNSAQGTGIEWRAVDNAMVSASAAIAYSKLNLASSIVNADVSASAAIALSKLAGSFSTYTPTWTTSGTAPAIGNGTISGRYIQIGKLVVLSLVFTAGSTSTFGTGSWSFTLPVTGSSTPVQYSYGGSANVLDSSASVRYAAMCFASSTTTVSVEHFTVSGSLVPHGSVTSTTPMTWASGDKLFLTLQYEAA